MCTYVRATDIVVFGYPSMKLGYNDVVSLIHYGDIKTHQYLKWCILFTPISLFFYYLNQNNMTAQQLVIIKAYI